MIDDDGPVLPSGRPVRLDGALLDVDALDDLLQRVVELAQLVIGAAHSVSITVLNGDQYHTSNAVGPEARAIDEAQYEENDGPCLEAIRTGRQLQVALAETAERWPLVTEQGLKLGIGTVLSTPMLHSPDDAIGALNIYSDGAEPFGHEQMRTASALGEHAAILVGNALALMGAVRLNDQLRTALASREVIGSAKGILMEREGCSSDQAFDMLRRASQRQNRKLRDLAEELVQRIEARSASPKPARRPRHRPWDGALTDEDGTKTP